VRISKTGRDRGTESKGAKLVEHEDLVSVLKLPAWGRWGKRKARWKADHPPNFERQVARKRGGGKGSAKRGVQGRKGGSPMY